jgi:ATP-dependent Clp protease ATP-binding subunit ClpA
MGRDAVDQESLFIGLLRQGHLTVALLASGGVDLPRLRASLLDRLERAPVEVPAEMTANPEVSAILMDARTLAEKEELLGSHHVLYALLRRASSRVLDLLQSAGGTKEKLFASIEQVLPRQSE